MKFYQFIFNTSSVVQYTRYVPLGFDDVPMVISFPSVSDKTDDSNDKSNVGRAHI